MSNHREIPQMYGKFTVVTYHHPFRHLETVILGAVEQRWVAQLAEYRRILKSIMENLTRMPMCYLPVTTEPEMEDTEKDFMVIREEEVRTTSWPASILGLTRNSCKTWAWCNIRCVDNGNGWRSSKVYWSDIYKIHVMGTKICQWVVSMSLQQPIYEAHHDHGGHFSAKGTLAKLRRSCYWPLMPLDIQTWMKVQELKL